MGRCGQGPRGEGYAPLKMYRDDVDALVADLSRSGYMASERQFADAIELSGAINLYASLALLPCYHARPEWTGGDVPLQGLLRGAFLYYRPATLRGLKDNARVYPDAMIRIIRSKVDECTLEQWVECVPELPPACPSRPHHPTFRG